VLIQPTITATLVGSQLQIAGSNGSASVVVQKVAGNPNTLEVREDGTLVNSFSTSAVSSIAVNLTGGGNELVVNEANGDPVPAGGLSYEGSTGSNTLVVNDAADTTARTVTLDTTTPGGDTPFGTITGLNAGTISYEYADTGAVTLDTGTAADTVNVLSTGSPSRSSPAAPPPSPWARPAAPRASPPPSAPRARLLPSHSPWTTPPTPRPGP
jgi:hypothetical protein